MAISNGTNGVDLVRLPVNGDSQNKQPNAELAINLLSAVHATSTILPGTADYERARASYWTREQVRATPACFFQPRTAAEVSVALIILQLTHCPFAVKSGGHGKFHGESSITDGITIDLAKLDHIRVNKSRTSVEIGPGNRWGDVYTALEPLGLTVVGGRAKTVGVGGFILGGGISFCSNLYGWALDNIQSYEVVLANGTIVNASKDSHEDLYKALRGGGGNFGIVTSFTVEAHPYYGMWGGPLGWDVSQGEPVMAAFLDCGRRAPEDPKAAFILGLSKYDGKWCWVGWLSYFDAVPEPRIFQETLAVPSVYSAIKLQDQTQMVQQMAEGYPYHAENTLWVACTKIDAHILRFWAETWMTEMDRLADVKGFKAQVAIQYITSNVIDRMSRNGGNGLGLAGRGPFLMFNAEPIWDDTSDNARVFSALQTVFHRTKLEAERVGQDHPYIYLNYASQYQDAFGGLNAETKNFHGQVSGKYDPEGIFQSLRGAGFKLKGAVENQHALT
ncbi:FAD binding domain-containing protein [Leptodontidium sp. MPI-SDFR-AT-0119]|nr:FAD binding domain-containing protein [Leptodontidium sp. MPI-SDFR-AT-0119]